MRASIRSIRHPRFGMGLEGNIHALPFKNFPRAVELRVRFGLLVMTENDLLNPYRSEELALIYPMSAMSQNERYEPWVVMAREDRLSNVSFGLGAAFLERKFLLDTHLGILHKEYLGARTGEFRGLEFGVDLVYNVAGK